MSVFVPPGKTFRMRLPGGTILSIQGHKKGLLGGYWIKDPHGSVWDYVGADYKESEDYGAPQEPDLTILRKLLQRPIEDSAFYAAMTSFVSEAWETKDADYFFRTWLDDYLYDDEERFDPNNPKVG